MSVDPKKSTSSQKEPTIKELAKKKAIKRNLKIAKSIIYNVSGSAPEAALYLLKAYKSLGLEANKEILEISKKTYLDKNVSKKNLIHTEIENLSRSVSAYKTQYSFSFKKLSATLFTTFLILITAYSVFHLFMVNKKNTLTSSSQKTQPSPLQSSLWKADFFCNKNLEGKSCLNKTLQKINVDWKGVSPYESIDAGNFSTRYQTCLRIQAEQKIYFSIGADDGYRVKINNKVVKKSWKIQGFKAEEFSIKLKKGIHKLTLEYFQGGGASRIEIKAGKNKKKLLEIKTSKDINC